MSRQVWDGLLAEARAAWSSRPELSEYCAFPDTLTPQEVGPFAMPAAALFAAETGLTGQSFPALRDASQAAEPLACWRDSYPNSNIPEDFRNRFGCYALIGEGGPFMSDAIRAWFVYMPAGLYYPWHHHKADEAYLVIGGEGVFRRADKPDQTLGEGDAMFHDSMEPHALETGAHPVLALVVWRADFEHRPVLTYEDAR